MEDTCCHLRFTCFISGFYLDKICLVDSDSLLLGSTIFSKTEALDDPVTRTALLSLICALMSLIYGFVKLGMMRNIFHASRWAEVSSICYLLSLIYGFVKLGMMRNIFHASRWAEVSSICYLLIDNMSFIIIFIQEAQKMKTSMLGNVWV
jgi:hypothetical protein